MDDFTDTAPTFNSTEARELLRQIFPLPREQIDARATFAWLIPAHAPIWIDGLPLYPRELEAKLRELHSTAMIRTFEVELLREQLDTARGIPRTYRVVDTADGTVLDLEDAGRVMDHLFAIGGVAGLRRFLIFKHNRRVRLPRGGEASAIARWLDDWGRGQ